jgi:hypothetical protein
MELSEADPKLVPLFRTLEDVESEDLYSLVCASFVSLYSSNNPPFIVDVVLSSRCWLCRWNPKL